MENEKRPSLAFRQTRAVRRNNIKRLPIVVFALMSCKLLVTLFALFCRQTKVPAAIDHDFGVGFDLTGQYGTAAISYPNGTVVNVAKIDAPVGLQKVLDRIAVESSDSSKKSCDSLQAKFSDYKGRMIRRARKIAGLPSTSDVAEIAQMVIALRDAVDAYLRDGRKIRGVVVTFPAFPGAHERPFPAFQTKDLIDAFEYAGLIYIATSPFWPGHGDYFAESGAVYVANGFGTCLNYTDIASCELEKRQHEYRPEVILSVSYTDDMLLSTWGIKSRHFGYAGEDRFIGLGDNLGWSQRHQFPYQDWYWGEVHNTIIRPIILANRWVPTATDRIFLHGSRVHEEKFRKVLMGALDSALPNKPTIYESEPIYSGARGAAEMAKQTYWTYNRTGRGQ